ncbi:MAG: DeoR/GlpR transcriptional regulator [Rhizobiales bacterium]|nr:DeoR/GlpR transcriptional regulator [Hyphomicrobiales bacterium]
MWAATRHKKILAILKQQKQISTDELAEEFVVSRETIRRDLLLLESEGSVNRIHGGVMLAKSINEEPFLQRKNSNQKEKRSIAKVAANLVQPNQSIFLDAGTTNNFFAEELKKLPELLIITNSIDIATSLYGARSKSKIILVGGQLISDVPGTYGELTLSEIGRFQVDIAFLSPVSICPEQGAAYFELHEAELARAMAQNAKKVVILADHSKVGEVSRVQCRSCTEIDLLITGIAVDGKKIADLKAAGLQTISLAK